MEGVSENYVKGSKIELLYCFYLRTTYFTAACIILHFLYHCHQLFIFVSLL